MALLTEAGLVRPETVIVTTVHQLQVVQGELPETDHDFSVDLIVTPDEVIRCGSPRRPSGIVLDHLSKEKAADIPALAAYLEGHSKSMSVERLLNGPNGLVVPRHRRERGQGEPQAGAVAGAPKLDGCSAGTPGLNDGFGARSADRTG